MQSATPNRYLSTVVWVLIGAQGLELLFILYGLITIYFRYGTLSGWSGFAIVGVLEAVVPIILIIGAISLSFSIFIIIRGYRQRKTIFLLIFTLIFSGYFLINFGLSQIYAYRERVEIRSQYQKISILLSEPQKVIGAEKGFVFLENGLNLFSINHCGLPKEADRYKGYVSKFVTVELPPMDVFKKKYSNGGSGYGLSLRREKGLTVQNYSGAMYTDIPVLTLATEGKQLNFCY